MKWQSQYSPKLFMKKIKTWLSYEIYGSLDSGFLTSKIGKNLSN